MKKFYLIALALLMPYSAQVYAVDVINNPEAFEASSPEEEQQAALMLLTQLLKYAQVNFFRDATALTAFDKASESFATHPETASNDMMQAAMIYFDNNFDALMQVFAQELGVDPVVLHGIFPRDLIKQTFIAKIEEFGFVYNAAGLAQRSAKNQRAPIRIKA